MLILSSTTDALQVITAASGTINVHCSWMDNTSGTVTPGRTNTAISTAATTSIVAPPAAATQRNIKTIHIANAGSSAVDITVQHTDGTIVSQLHKVTLAGGTTLQYIDEVGFTTASGGISTSFSPATNLIINSGMEVSQESIANAINSISNLNRYTIDMFGVHVLGSVVITAQQIIDAPAGYKNSLKVSVTTADTSIAAGDKALIYAVVEGYRCARLGFGAAGAQNIALGFWVKANRTGTYSASIENFNVNRCYPFNFSVNSSATWEYKTATIPGDVTGTWRIDNAAGLYINWVMMAGTTFTGSANSWNPARTEAVTGTLNGVAATTDYMQICGVSLIPGTNPVAQGTIVTRNFDEELVLCRRYYEKSYNYLVAPQALSTPGELEWGLSLNSGTNAEMTAPARFSVHKRAAPAFSVYSPNTGAASKVWESLSNTDVPMSVGNLGESGSEIQAAIGGSPASVYFNAHWVADARL